ncbi:hypothetical protein BU24DRAFT_487541 [Aaosphaeria arxii CBS 175.79]|uniref:50S ribosomal protein-like protein YmL27 n=1 Tax=Aaosphaeria arxii CBS 175.79 TaxID=1450172 RepID=A0A6A5Y8G6_9PLEO|nr:uncharacterized protein BU24DRAFT_487541 [Aaosphaeria arxii CBS 175.79]KAF2021041.1 hypothetical protein BU24DRAFT_487541 [Aaosphaeria arxii CBS 175.79]
MKATQALFGRLRRLPLTTKQTRKGFYKGNGVGHLGSWDPVNHRVFKVDYSKVRTFVYPLTGLDGFELTPFVGRHISKNVQSDDGKWSIPQKTFTGEEYLRMWKEEGDHNGGY